MKELRSVVTAVFLFLVFLFLWSFVVPGYSGEGRRPPVPADDGREKDGSTVQPARKVSFSVLLVRPGSYGSRDGRRPARDGPPLPRRWVRSPIDLVELRSPTGPRSSATSTTAR
jgi:hypothetical protein